MASDETQKRPLVITPPETVIPDLVLTNQLYNAQVHISNSMSYPVTFTIRAGTPERWEVVPSSLTLESKQTCAVDLRLRLNKPLPRTRKQEFRGIQTWC